MLLRLSILLIAYLWTLSARCAPILRKRDADFESVRSRLSRDHSGKSGDPKDKYFHESTVPYSPQIFAILSGY
jgi:hypothetical protein